MIGVLDYGIGNIRAFLNVYERLNIPCRIIKSSQDFININKIILPGVGAFDHAINAFNKSGLRNEVERLVFNEKIPILGICVGMQMLGGQSEEGVLPGLNWIRGSVRKFNPEKIDFKTRLPHMGWNSINIVKPNRLLYDLNIDSRFYFLHSYYFECENDENILSQTNYGITYSSAIFNDNIFGVQFHPEKSHQNGVTLLSNFANI